MSKAMTVRESSKLSAAEERELVSLERAIETTRGALIALATALTEIRDKKLYRATYSSFEAYCQDRWGFTRQRAHQLMDGATTLKGLPAKCQQLLTNEGQARALSLVPPEKRAEVLDAAKASGSVTAKSIREAAQQAGGDGQVIEMDREGYPIPESILEDWLRADRQRELMESLSDVRTSIKKGMEARDVVFAEMSNTTLAELNHVYGTVKLCVLPYAVCTSCEGHGREKCGFCKGRGFLSEQTWKVADSRVKEIRKRAAG